MTKPDITRQALSAVGLDERRFLGRLGCAGRRGGLIVLIVRGGPAGQETAPARGARCKKMQPKCNQNEGNDSAGLVMTPTTPTHRPADALSGPVRA